MIKRILVIALLVVLIACKNPPTPTSKSTSIPSPTSTAVPPPTPFWGPAAWACSGTCTLTSSEPITWEVKPGERVQGGTSDTGFVVFTYRLNRSAPPLRLASFQADLLVENTGYTEPYFNVVLDLHGVGTVRSWYAQIGYVSYSGNLGIFCQAYSYNSDTPSYSFDAPYSPGYGTWHTFKIEVLHTDTGWQYGFQYYYDGMQICSYQPPDLWDGDNRYRVLWQAASIYPNKGTNTSEVPLRAQVRNAYLFVLDSPGP